MILLITGLLLLVAALGFTLFPRMFAPLSAFAGLLVLHMGYHIFVPPRYLWFWAVAAMIAAAIYHLAPVGEPDGKRVSNLYIVSTGVAGILLGILLEPRIMVLGAIIGTALGVMAYSGTPAGRWLRSSWRYWVHYYAAKALPAVVTISIVGVALMGFIS